MPEYIELEAAVKKIREYGVLGVGYSDEERENNVVDMLECLPVADVEPVVHGRWIRYHEADIGWDEYGYRCSKCKVELEDKDFWDIFKIRCPKCGARMDGADQ